MAHYIGPYLHTANQLRINSKAELHRINGVKESFFIFLQILVVGERQSLYCREHCHEMTDDTPGLSAHKFGDIGIFLLRHHGRSGTVCIVQFNKRELTGTPEDNLF